MSEILYSISTVSGDTLWQSDDPSPVFSDISNNVIVDTVRPMYFSAEEMISRLGTSIAEIREAAISIAQARPRTKIVNHPSVLESSVTANSKVSLWYIPSDDLDIPKLNELYHGDMLEMAKLRSPEETITTLDKDDPFCIFVTEVLPSGSRMDIHRDGREPVIIINLSEMNHRGRTLIGHPDLLSEPEITEEMLWNDSRTLVQQLRPGTGVVFDVTKVPHVGLSDAGDNGYRVVLDADYKSSSRDIDWTVYNSYAR